MQLHDVFICHTSEDKKDFVRPLAEALRARHLDVWYDEFALTVGDSLSEAIDRGLARCRFGIVVLSPSFFEKGWPRRELSGLVQRQVTERRRLILPIWHGVDHSQILKYSPPLADLLAISSAQSLDSVVSELLKTLRPEESPLVVARDFLIDKGVSTPVVTDEWWLDIIEIAEGTFRFPDLNLGRRWIFPLPYPGEVRGKERGLNIAWTILQLDWMHEGEDRKLCQLTPPEQLHEFLQEWPGLFECVRSNPAVLAMYAPQLTLPGFDDGLSDVFDQMLDSKGADGWTFGYSPPDTIDGEEPLCSELISWRHPKFGNYTNAELAHSFVSAHNGQYSRHLFSHFECLVWLLSDAAHWMPHTLRESLLDGMRSSSYGWSTDVISSDVGGALRDALFKSPRAKFIVTRGIRTALVELCTEALQKLGIKHAPNDVADRFLAKAFVEGFYDKRKEQLSRQRRRGRRADAGVEEAPYEA